MAQQGFNATTKELIIVYTATDIKTAVERDNKTITTELALRMMRECENDLIDALTEDWQGKVEEAISTYLEDEDFTEEVD